MNFGYIYIYIYIVLMDFSSWFGRLNRNFDFLNMLSVDFSLEVLIVFFSIGRNIWLV